MARTVRGRWIRLVVICGGLVVLYFVVPVEHHVSPDAVLLRTAGAVLTLGLLAVLIVRQLRHELDGTDRRVDGLVASIVAVVMTFALAFFVLDQNNPGQLSGISTRIDALYFTMSTLSTVGYGDVHAIGQAARLLVVVQMVFNLLFVTSAAALLSGRIRRVAADRAAAHRQPP